MMWVFRTSTMYNVILEGYTDNDIDTKPLFAALFAAREHCSVR